MSDFKNTSTDIELDGPVVAEVQRLFIDEWYYQRGYPLSPRNYFPQLERRGDQIVRVVASAPQQISTPHLLLRVRGWK